MSGIVIDLIFLLILAIFTVVGMFRGFFSTLLSILGFVGSILIAYFFRDQTVAVLDWIFGFSDWLNGLLGESVAQYVIPAGAIIIAFILLKLLVFILEHTIGKLLKKGLVGRINKVLGLVLGFIKGVLYSFAFCAIVSILTLIPSVKTFVDEKLEGTYIISFVYNLIDDEIEKAFTDQGGQEGEEGGEEGVVV